MTNFEKYKDELCKILSHYVGVSDDKPRICNDLSCKNCDFDDYGLDCIQEVEDWLKKEVTKRPLVDVPDMNVGKCSEIPNSSTDCISRQDVILELPSVHPEQRYTEEELRVFKHGISLSLLSKRSSQHWKYDEDTATEIKFLERLYEKVVADMRGEQE